MTKTAHLGRFLATTDLKWGDAGLAEKAPPRLVHPAARSFYGCGPYCGLTGPLYLRLALHTSQLRGWQPRGPAEGSRAVACSPGGVCQRIRIFCSVCAEPGGLRHAAPPRAPGPLRRRGGAYRRCPRLSPPRGTGPVRPHVPGTGGELCRPWGISFLPLPCGPGAVVWAPKCHYGGPRDDPRDRRPSC